MRARTNPLLRFTPATSSSDGKKIRRDHRCRRVDWQGRSDPNRSRPATASRIGLCVQRAAVCQKKSAFGRRGPKVDRRWRRSSASRRRTPHRWRLPDAETVRRDPSPVPSVLPVGVGVHDRQRTRSRRAHSASRICPHRGVHSRLFEQPRTGYCQTEDHLSGTGSSMTVWLGSSL
jgi:hypothetical protein